MSVPNEFDSVATIILDRGDGEKIPERSAILLVVEKPPAVTCPILDGISYLRHFIMVRLGALQKPAAFATYTHDETRRLFN